jgi:hypothetical protein
MLEDVGKCWKVARGLHGQNTRRVKNCCGQQKSRANLQRLENSGNATAAPYSGWPNVHLKGGMEVQALQLAAAIHETGHPNVRGCGLQHQNLLHISFFP